MVSEKQLIAYLLFCAAVCHAQMSEGTEGGAREGDLFSLKGYPKPGDIPVLNRKIFRAARVTIMEHPYMVSVRRNLAQYLTGALVTHNTVLTVAHPLYNVPTYELGVVIGENYSDRGGAMLTVLLVILHQKFNPYSLVADLAMIRVYEDMIVKVNQKTIPICYENLSDLIDKKEGNLAFVSGWGRCDWSAKEFCLPRSSIYYPDEKVDPMLRTISFNIVGHTPNHYCVGYRKHGVQIKLGMLCAGTAREEEALAPCLAVPGAPLVVRGHLVGLQSWGFGCGYVHDLPLIYTHLAFYHSWIKHNLAVLTTINASDLSELYSANRAFLLLEWLKRTRQNVDNKKGYSNFPLHMSLIDKKLILLKGNVTDFRDYILNGMFQQEKLELYGKVRKHLAREHKIEELANYTLRTGQPFFNHKMQEEVDFS